jgi:hypothetical protein
MNGHMSLLGCLAVEGAAVADAQLGIRSRTFHAASFSQGLTDTTLLVSCRAWSPGHAPPAWRGGGGCCAAAVAAARPLTGSDAAWRWARGRSCARAGAAADTTDAATTAGTGSIPAAASTVAPADNARESHESDKRRHGG